MTSDNLFLLVSAFWSGAPGFRSTTLHRPRSLFCLAILLIRCALPATSFAQSTVTVPEEIRFADQRLALSKEARKKIQTDVDALLRNQKYFLNRVERVDAYFPLIEAVLREEKVPEDIKYLVIQESALVGDAVSSSRAVGYWQFKEPAAEEVGLTINGAVDERMNIVAATRGAARYFKSNNARFDNWLYAVMAFYEGPGGALKKADKSQYGARKMRLRGNTHWYVLKFLSHKIAFESAVGQDPSPPVQLTAHTDRGGQTLADVARSFDVEVADLEPYNRWLKQRRIPQDKLYSVIVPHYDGDPVAAPLAQQYEPRPVERERSASEPAVPTTTNPTPFAERSDTEEFPLVREVTRRGQSRVLVNGLPGIIAQAGEDVGALARRSGLSSSKLVRYNDLQSQHARIEAGQPYYLRPKRNRALAHYHTVSPGESLWSVSQRLGIKMKKLLRNNRLREEEALKPGRVLWARFIRPAHVDVTYRLVPTPPSDEAPLASREEVIEAPSLAEQEVAVDSDASPISSPEPPLSEDSVADRAVPVTTAPAEKDLDTDNLNTEEEDAVWRAEDVPTEHTVAAGETLYSIAQQYQISPKQLATYNDISFGDALTPGQQLQLTARANTGQPTERPTDATDGARTHEVQPGETMFQIARNYGITIKELMEWNNKEGFDLAVGETIRVAR